MADVEIRDDAPSADDLRYYDYSYMRPGRLVTHHEPSSAWTAIAGKLGDVQRAGAAQLVARAPRGPIGVLADRLADVKSGVRAMSPASSRPSPDVEPALRHAVDTIIDAWFEGSAHQATMRRAGKHPCFVLLQRTGAIAIERIVNRLRGDPNALWVWALGELTGQDPARGTETISEAAQAWIAWADERGLD